MTQEGLSLHFYTNWMSSSHTLAGCRPSSSCVFPALTFACSWFPLDNTLLEECVSRITARAVQMSPTPGNRGSCWDLTRDSTVFPGCCHLPLTSVLGEAPVLWFGLCSILSPSLGLVRLAGQGLTFQFIYTYTSGLIQPVWAYTSG